MTSPADYRKRLPASPDQSTPLTYTAPDPAALTRALMPPPAPPPPAELLYPVRLNEIHEGQPAGTVLQVTLADMADLIRRGLARVVNADETARTAPPGSPSGNADMIK
jgi:hypothetical protein